LKEREELKEREDLEEREDLKEWDYKKNEEPKCERQTSFTTDRHLLFFHSFSNDLILITKKLVEVSSYPSLTFEFLFHWSWIEIPRRTTVLYVCWFDVTILPFIFI
jgi:hypothetical protein